MSGVSRPAAPAMRRLATLAALGACLGSCASLESSTAPSSGGSVSITDRISNLFGGGASTASATPAAQGPAPLEDWECPSLDVRSGASTIAVYGPGEQSGSNLRYQATIGQMARECGVIGPNLTMKVGVQGRVVLGPAGGAGQLDVPLRIALVIEGPTPKTLWTKLYRVPVPISGGQGNVPFVHVESDLTIPRPSGTDLETAIVYVGFDQNMVPERPRGRAQPRSR